MSYQSGFEHAHQVVRWVAGQFPNLPHIQHDLVVIADKLEAESQEAAAGLVEAVEVAGSGAGSDSEE